LLSNCRRDATAWWEFMVVLGPFQLGMHPDAPRMRHRICRGNVTVATKT
jgi:hypothetical protein